MWKNSSSIAESQATNVYGLSELPTIQKLRRTREGFVKSLFIFTCDGGIDGNLRYELVIVSAVQHFKNFDLDAINVATNAPGRSVFNRVERRMSPLSSELSGVVLKHYYFCLRLDSSN